MGYSIPTAMGAKIVRPEKDVWVVVGDGGIQMNIQELVTLAQDSVPLKILLLNNGFLGMVRQWQELFFDKNYSETRLFNPDFVKLAEACHVKALSLDSFDNLSSVLSEMKEYSGVILCECKVEAEENVYPMVPAGKSLSDLITGL